MIVFMEGVNGAGKTTLLNHIATNGLDTSYGKPIILTRPEYLQRNIIENARLTCESPEVRVHHMKKLIRAWDKFFNSVSNTYTNNRTLILIDRSPISTLALQVNPFMECQNSSTKAIRDCMNISDSITDDSIFKMHSELVDLLHGYITGKFLEGIASTHSIINCIVKAPVPILLERCRLRRRGDLTFGIFPTAQDAINSYTLADKMLHRWLYSESYSTYYTATLNTDAPVDVCVNNLENFINLV